MRKYAKPLIIVLLVILVGFLIRKPIKYMFFSCPEDMLFEYRTDYKVEAEYIYEPVIIDAVVGNSVDYKGCRITVSDIRSDGQGTLITLSFKNPCSYFSGKLLTQYNQFDERNHDTTEGTVSVIYEGNAYACKKRAGAYRELTFGWDYPYSEDLDFKLIIDNFCITTYKRVLFNGNS
jgi:hypothetical protein